MDIFDKDKFNIIFDIQSNNAHEQHINRFKQCAHLGIFRNVMPKSLGGFENTYFELCEQYENLGNKVVDTGLILSLHAHFWGGIYAIFKFGTDHQRSTWLPLAISGNTITGQAMTEPKIGSDIIAMQTYAEETSKGFILNGHKRYITNAPIADWLLIYAKTSDGISAFIVKKDDNGVQFIDGHKVAGCISCPIGEVILTNSLLPVDRLVGNLNSGSSMIQHILEHERAFLFSGILGIMEWQLEYVLKHVKKRVVSNKPLTNNQAISHKLAEMRLRIDTVRLWIKNCAYLKDNAKRISLASAQTKLFASEAFLQSSIDAVQILGAAGLECDSILHQLTLDALAGRLFSGSSEIQRNIIASLIGAA